LRVLTVGTLYPPQHLGGYELVWQGAVRALRARGHTVRVLCTDTVLHPGAPEQDADVHRQLRWLWRDHAWPRLGRAERRAIARHDLRVLEAHVAALEPDVVAWFPVGGLPLALLGHARPVPSAAFVHDDWPDYGARADTTGRHGDTSPAASRRGPSCPARPAPRPSASSARSRTPSSPRRGSTPTCSTLSRPARGAAGSSRPAASTRARAWTSRSPPSARSPAPT
jgi:hypothetical protein